MTTQLITIDELKSYPLPVKENQWDKITDPTILNAINIASQNVEDWLDRGIASAYYSERIQGHGRDRLILDQYPVISVQGIASADNQENSTVYDTASFIIDSNAGMLIWKDRYRNEFWRGYDWVVNYYAGYETIPYPIKHATALEAIQVLSPLFRGGSNFTEIKLIDGINEAVVDLLEKYKRKRIG